MNRNEVTFSLFAVYSKAFDTVDHKTLLHKLHSLQFSHSSLHLMNSYLSERKQFVQIDDKRLPLARVYYGVTQGSILGPILFNLYVRVYQNVQLANVFNYLVFSMNLFYFSFLYCLLLISMYLFIFGLSDGILFLISLRN